MSIEAVMKRTNEMLMILNSNLYEKNNKIIEFIFNFPWCGTVFSTRGKSSKNK